MTVKKYAARFEGACQLDAKVRAVFNAARDDYEGGYLTSFKSLVQADVFDNGLHRRGRRTPACSRVQSAGTGQQQTVASTDSSTRDTSNEHRPT